MKSRLRFALLLPAAVLIGCTLPSTPPSGTTLSGNWANWQIQTGNSTITPPTALTSPPTGFYLVGAMQAQGSQVTAIFQDGGTSPVNFTGSFNSTTSVLGLSSAPPQFGVQLTLPSNLTDLATGNMSIGCPPPPVGGATCTAIALFPAAGAEIASLTGTYAGTLTDTSSPSLSGAATLTLTQSVTPNSSGQFPLSGTITFPADSGFGTAQLAGTVSGEGITLSDSSAAPNSPTVNVTASASPDASQITVSSLLYSNFGPGAVFLYTGVLTRQ